MTDKINHAELAISRLVTQFKESPNLITNIQLLVAESDVLELTLCDIIEKRYLDNATGEQLNVIGEIVGQTRELIDSNLIDYFGFDSYFRSSSFSSFADPSLGGRFVSKGESVDGVRILTDVEYRSFIRARIAKNMTRSTPEDIIAQIGFIFQTNIVIFLDGDTEYTVSIGKILSQNEKSILFNTDIILKTAGVQANYLSDFDSDRYFGFQGVPNSSGLGSTLNSTIGGNFSSLI